MDSDGHGTHCAGTVAGDGTSGKQTGIAPDATIMAIKIWNSRYDAVSVDIMIEGFEFAVDNGAHVISLSGGIEQRLVTDSDKTSLREAMVNVLEAGIIAAVASGNEYGLSNSIPVPNMVRCPSSCPPPWLHPDQTTKGGLSCVMSVGATDVNDNLWRDLTQGSSIGPVTWQTVEGYYDYAYNPGMGLIRPDVCAPGTGIISLAHDNPTGYTGGWWGTSMAAPCVAGVMALMLSKNINLTPAEICEILETTAVRLPYPNSKKDNLFGSGRIDAYAAVMATPCSPVDFFNQTVTTNTTVTNNCGDINVKNVKVKNGAKLILDAARNVNIISDFEVDSGSEFEIK